VDADEVAHQLTRPGSALVERIAAEFGREFVGEKGQLDRRKLARAAFSSQETASRLNAITHPAIEAETERMIAELADDGRALVICLVAPLLLEAGYAGRGKVDRVLVMAADGQERIRRVVKRDGLTEEEVRQRMAAQMPEDEQRRLADWVVDTTAGKEQAEQQLERIWSELQRA
jgi:dephospho-CoA kinase